MQTDTGTPAEILVIDDDTLTRTMIAGVLTKNGYRVLQAADGETGMAMTRERNPALILLDVMMPVLDGYETCRRLRQFTDLNETPVIMLTGLNDGDSADQAFEAGANDFISKPINWPLLVKRLRYALRDREMHRALRQRETLLRLSQRIARLSSWEIELPGQAMTLSDTFHETFGVDIVSPAPLQAYLDLVHPEDRLGVGHILQLVIQEKIPQQIDHRIVSHEGKTLIVRLQAELIPGGHGTPDRVHGVLQDITHQSHAEALVEFQRFHDELTGLPNKTSFYELLESRTSALDHARELLGVAFIGIDRFKKITDSLGHTTGDILLQTAADRLKKIVAGRASVSRYASDTFALITNPAQHIDNINNLLDETLRALAMPYVIQKEEIHTSASIGATVYPIEDGTPETLANAADQAMNTARLAGGNQYCYHTSQMNEDIRRRHSTEKLIRHALEHGGFHLFYQPQVLASHGRLVGAEALLRLQTADGRWISPLDFIPVAEETGLILPLGDWIIADVCRQMRQWLDNGLAELRVGINLSPLQFGSADLTNKLLASAQRYCLRPDTIDLEITESAAMADMAGTIAVLNGFKQAGFTISMDDFGTGYSSLSTLHQLPIDILKIDRSFIKDIQPGGENGAIARTIVAMAHSLNMRVIAEGVETREQAVFLASHGCEEIQGFYYSKPLPADAFASYCIQQGHTMPASRQA